MKLRYSPLTSNDLTCEKCGGSCKRFGVGNTYIAEKDNIYKAKLYIVKTLKCENCGLLKSVKQYIY